MTMNLIHQIKWNHIYSGEAYLYGTELRLTKEGVTFDNPRIASGKRLVQFQSRTNYQGNRHSPSLPLLVPGQKYIVRTTISSEPQGRFFLEFNYFNRQGKKIAFDILRDQEGEIDYPEEAFTYTITLRSAGCASLVFEEISIYSLNTSNSVKLSNPSEKRYTEKQLPDELQLVKNLIKII